MRTMHGRSLLAEFIDDLLATSCALLPLAQAEVFPPPDELDPPCRLKRLSFLAVSCYQKRHTNDTLYHSSRNWWLRMAVLCVCDSHG